MDEQLEHQNHIERLTEALPLPSDFSIIETGHYLYWLNDAPIKIVEPWLKAQNSLGQMRIHSGRFADEYGITLLVSHQTGSSTGETTPNKIKNFVSHLSWQQQGQADISAAYQYCEAKQQLNIEIKGEGQDKIMQQHRADSFLYFPLLRVFGGDIMQILDAQGPLTTIVPDIRTPQVRPSLLHPTTSLRSAKNLGQQQIQIAEKNYDTHRYAYFSEHYQSEDDTAFWLNSQGLLLKYCWQQSAQQHWKIVLQSHQTHNHSVSKNNSEQ